MRLRVWGLLSLISLTIGCGKVSGPTVTQDDIVLRASLHPSDLSACLPEVQWVLEVELGRAREVPLHAGERAYMYEVNVFDGERPLSPHAAGGGCDERGQFGPQFSLGNDGRTYAPAVRAAHQSGDLPKDYPETLSSASGFTYLGDEFPVKVRYYLKEALPPEKIAVIYSHYEKRRGRDYSWTKTVYAERPLCQAPEGWNAVAYPLIPAAFDPDRPNGILGLGTDGRIWRVQANGEMPEPISTGAYSSMSASGDGRWMAGRRAGSMELWLLDRATGEERSLGLEGQSVGDWRPR